MTDKLDAMAAAVAGYVDVHLQDCDHTFKHRDAAIEQFELQHRKEAICERLAELGGCCCDCEIVLNATSQLPND